MAVSSVASSTFNPLHIARPTKHSSPSHHSLIIAKASNSPSPSEGSGMEVRLGKFTKLTQKKVSKSRRMIDLGLVGILAASVIGFTPLDANATRIEYYATVAEPSCELNFVRSGLGYCDIAPGSGPQVPYSGLIDIHYTARFGDETVFDSSYKRGRPLTMRMGVGKVIKGLDQGIYGGDGVPPMQVGGKRRLYIPPELAYGSEPAGCFYGDCNIPANATLLYEIDFVRVYSGNRKL